MGGGTMNIDLPIIQFKPASSSTLPSFSSPPSSSLNFPVSVNSNNAPLRQSCTAAICSCTSGNCARIQSQQRGPVGSLSAGIFGPVPSRFEVESAIAALQNFLHGTSSELQEILDVKMLSRGCGRVCNAFHLLQTDPSMKRLVASLSSDEALWNAVTNNEMMRQRLQESCKTAESYRLKGKEKVADPITWTLNWMIDLTRAKITELIQKFQSLMNQVLQPLESEKATGGSREEIDENIRSSMILSLVVLLIVVVARSYNLGT